MSGIDFLKRAARLLAVFLCLIPIGTTSVVFGDQPAPVTAPAHTDSIGYTEIAGKDRIAKIVSVLETRRSDRKVIEKAEEKLLTLDEGKLRLMSSLCDRIAGNLDSPGADIAFSLVTAMIVLS